MKAKVIAHSVSNSGKSIVSWEVESPRFIWAEMLTHRCACLSGDTVIEFDFPSGAKGWDKRLHSMTIREFAKKWHDGAEAHKPNRLSEKKLIAEDDRMYSASEIADLLDLKSHLNLNKKCRVGAVSGAMKTKENGWVATGKAWKEMRETSVRSFSIKGRLKKMRIRQIDENTNEIRHSTVTNVFISGVKKVFVLKAGIYSVKASEDHRIFTSEGWKRLGDLKVGEDKVCAYKTGRYDHHDKHKKIDGKWVPRWNLSVRKKIFDRQGGICAHSGEELKDNFHIHHVIPRHERPDLAFDESNVVALTPEAHKKAHEKQGWQKGEKKKTDFFVVESIDLVGEEMTYDLEIAGEFPNFFADGIVVHNSRNASSSRAIPNKKLTQDILDNTAMPVFWGGNQSGMQAGDEINALVQCPITGELLSREEAWRRAAASGVAWARAFSAAGYHKQLSNRLCENLGHIRAVITATEVDGFYNLRCHEDAQPEIQKLATLMRNAHYRSKPVKIGADGWHLPYVTPEDIAELTRIVSKKMEGDHSDFLLIIQKVNLLARMVSAARCARVSYKTFHGVTSTLKEDLALCSKLIGSEPGHWSPFEHQATPQILYKDEYLGKEFSGNFVGWSQSRKMIEKDPNLFNTVMGYENV